MWALIAFIVLGVSIAALIEINERVKKSKAEREKTADAQREKTADAQREKPEQEDCSGCALIDVCEKEEKKH